MKKLFTNILITILILYSIIGKTKEYDIKDFHTYVFTDSIANTDKGFTYYKGLATITIDGEQHFYLHEKLINCSTHEYLLLSIDNKLSGFDITSVPPQYIDEFNYVCKISRTSM